MTNHHQEEMLLTDYYTIAVTFTDEANAKRYIYKVDKTMEVAVGDIVIVAVSMKYKFCKVQAVHEVAKVNFNSNIRYKYIVDVLDTTTYDRLAERSAQIAKTLEEVERSKLKRDLRSTFSEVIDSESAKKLEEAGITIEGRL